MINIGLALKQIKAGQSKIRININTIPVEYLPKPRPIIEIVSWAFVPVAVIVLISTAVLMGQALERTSVLQVKVDNARARTQSMLGTTEDMEKLQARLDEVRAELLAYQPYLDSTAIQREKVSDDLSMITSLLPGTIVLDSIIYEEVSKKKEWNISGTASDEAVILGYCADLDSTARFDHVIVLTMTVRDYNEVDFTAALISKVE